MVKTLKEAFKNELAKSTTHSNLEAEEIREMSKAEAIAKISIEKAISRGKLSDAISIAKLAGEMSDQAQVNVNITPLDEVLSKARTE